MPFACACLLYMDHAVKNKKNTTIGNDVKAMRRLTTEQNNIRNKIFKGIQKGQINTFCSE